MLYVGLVVGFYLLVAYLEVPRMLKHRMFRELWVFLVLSLLGLLLSVGQICHWPLPNLTKGVEAIFRPLHLRLEELLLPPGTG
ncbi:hypothetical protein [Desulfothermobacter acidiphilus]|uniref:hypothetical protein n=1 Tax=Desulfothermobacter acidiphilus TaxID=1938353 RepID=UPI003F8CACCE